MLTRIRAYDFQLHLGLDRKPVIAESLHEFFDGLVQPTSNDAAFPSHVPNPGYWESEVVLSVFVLRVEPHQLRQPPDLQVGADDDRHRGTGQSPDVLSVRVEDRGLEDREDHLVLPRVFFELLRRQMVDVGPHLREFDQEPTPKLESLLLALSSGKVGFVLPLIA